MKASATSPHRRAHSADVLESESSAHDGHASVGLESLLPAPNSSPMAAETTPTAPQASSANEPCINTPQTHTMSTRRNDKRERYRNTSLQYALFEHVRVPCLFFIRLPAMGPSSSTGCHLRLLHSQVFFVNDFLAGILMTDRVERALSASTINAVVRSRRLSGCSEQGSHVRALTPQHPPSLDPFPW